MRFSRERELSRLDRGCPLLYTLSRESQTGFVNNSLFLYIYIEPRAIRTTTKCDDAMLYIARRLHTYEFFWTFEHRLLCMISGESLYTLAGLYRRQRGEFRIVKERDSGCFSAFHVTGSAISCGFMGSSSSREGVCCSLGIFFPRASSSELFDIQGDSSRAGFFFSIRVRGERLIASMRIRIAYYSTARFLFAE